MVPFIFQLRRILSFLIGLNLFLLSHILHGQNDVIVKVYDDNLSTTSVIDGSPSNFGDSFYAVVYQNNTVVSDAVSVVNGMATITNVPDGTYGIILTRQQPSSGDQMSGVLPLSINNGDEELTGIAVGTPATITEKYTSPDITDVDVNSNTEVSFGFTDKNNFGSITGRVTDISGAGVENATIRLLDNTGTVIAETLTKSSTNSTNPASLGTYTFDNLLPGMYNVVEVQPDGYSDESENEGGDDNDTGDNGITNNIAVILDPGETDSGNDFVDKVVIDEIPCSSGTTEVNFEWSSSPGSGNEWLYTDSGSSVSKTYTLSYTDQLGNPQTIDVTLTMTDPDGINIDDNFVCPIPGNTCSNPSATGVSTRTNGVYGAGYLTVFEATENSNQNLTFDFSFSKPVFMKNFSVGDIDWASLKGSSGDKTYISFQDEIILSAGINGSSSPINVQTGAKLTSTSTSDGISVYPTLYYFNEDGSGVDGNAGASDPANTVYVNSENEINEFRMIYSNGPGDVVNDNNGYEDPGESNSHAVRVNGFTFCIVDYASIQGQVSEDTTGDNEGDTNKPDITVVLKNADGTPATYADGTAIPAITTSDGTTDIDGDGNIDPAGSYYIPNLATGDYIVEIVKPSGYNNVKDGDTTPEDDDATSNTDTKNNAIPVTLTAAERDENNDFVIANSSLPVSLLSFSCTSVQNDVKITWESANEINNDYFEVEYSFDGESFQTLATLDSKGYSAYTQTYTYMHKSIAESGNNTVFYKLKQVDEDGSFAYVGGVKRVVLNNTKALGLYPNPVKRGSILSINGLKTKQEYTIYNSIGKLMHTGTGDSSNSFNTTTLKPGVYYIQISGHKVKSFIVLQ